MRSAKHRNFMYVNLAKPL